MDPADDPGARRRHIPGEVSVSPRGLMGIPSLGTGAWASQIAVPPSRETASHQIVVGDIPREAPGFQPRPDLLAKLDRISRGVQLLTGMPGAGTTQLAAAYARAKLATDWRLVAWVNAASTGNLLAGLASVADAAGLLDDSSRRGSADAGQLVRQWLETDGDCCLLVFDDPEDLDTLRPFLPAGDAQVLITRTRRISSGLGASISVDAFSPHEALAFMSARTGLTDTEGAAAVGAELAHLPAALAQAAAVIGGHRLAYQTYLDQLRAIPVREYPAQEEQAAAYPQYAMRAVRLSLQAIRAADRTGVGIRAMEIVAVLSAAGVRRELLYIAGQTGLLASGGHRVATALVDGALKWLSNRSLLTLGLDSQTIIMPGLVARTVRDELVRKRRLAEVCWTAASVLEAHAVAVAGSHDRAAIRDIPQQVTALLDNADRLAGEMDEELAETLLRLRFISLYHLIELGDSIPQTIAVGEALAEDLVPWLGPENPDTLNARNSLAAAYLAAGRTAEAIPLFEQTLAIRERLLGADHPDTLTSQNNLAAAYQDAGQTAEAIRRYELNLAARERLLGADHPSTLTSRGNLATAYRDAGRVAEAIPLFERTLTGREQVLRADHPDSRTSRENLAAAYRDAGRAAEAAALAEQNVAGRKRTSSPRTRLGQQDRGPVHRGGGAEVEWTSATRSRQAPAGGAGRVPPADFRRPPAGPARPGLPDRFRRPPAARARQARPDGVAFPPASLTDYSAPGRPSGDVQDDRELAAAIAAGDSAGIAMAYDRYAAGLYGYCHSMVHDRAGAAEATLDTFVIAVAKLRDLPKAPELRPWLYALARGECQHLLRTRARIHGERAAPEGLTAGVRGEPGPAQLRTLIGTILAGFKPRERELVELRFRHDLPDSDLAEALGLPHSRAQVLAARSRDRLEEALRALRVTLTGREACPVLNDLLVDWDGQLTEQTCELVGWHTDQCQTCASSGQRPLRPAALSGLLPLAPLPPELREQVLDRCSSTAEDAVSYRRRLVRRAEVRWFAGFSRAMSRVSWNSIRANPGAATATVAVALWIVAAVGITLFIFTGSHAAVDAAARPTVGNSSSRPAIAAAPAADPTSRAARVSSSARQSLDYGPSPIQPTPSSSPSPLLVVSSSSTSRPSPKPSKSASPKPSKSASPSPSRTASPSPSPSLSSSPSPSGTP